MQWLAQQMLHKINGNKILLYIHHIYFLHQLGAFRMQWRKERMWKLCSGMQFTLTEQNLHQQQRNNRHHLLQIILLRGHPHAIFIRNVSIGQS